MPKLTTYATIVILACCPFAFFACGGDDPVSPPEDTTRPTVISVSPPNGSTFVSVTSDISVTFSEGMDRTTMILSTLTIEPAVIGTVSYADKVLTFEPDTFLLGDTTYTVTVTTAAKDKAGNALASAYVWQFSTDLDTTAPTVLSTSPSANAINVPVNNSISIRFSEDMDLATMTAAAFQITPLATGAVTYADSVLTFTLDSFLVGGISYEATINTTATDTAGNPLASDFSWQFTTFQDNDPPNGAMSNPGNEAVVGNSTKIAVDASDATGVDKVVFYIDGSEVVGSDDSTAPYEYTWEPTGLDTGSVHQLTAEVFDVLGNHAFIDTVTVHYLWKVLITDDDEELIHRDINEVAVRSTGSLLEFRVETFGGWTNYLGEDLLGFDIAIYLDTDQNRATGDTTASDGHSTWDPPGVIGLNDIGADYMILIGYQAHIIGQADILQSWADTVWSNEGAVDILNISSNSNYFEVGVLRDRIGLPGTVDVVAFSFTLFKNPLIPGDPGTYKWDWAPNEGLGHATYEVDGSFRGKRGLPSGAASNGSQPSLRPMPEPFN